jgi:type IV pilus assembly protein PilV
MRRKVMHGIPHAHLVSSKRSARSQQGVVLLESLIAILIFSMGVLALVGLQAAMIKNTSDAKYRVEAMFIAQQKLGEIWANASNFVNLADYGIAIGDAKADVSTLLPAGKRSVEISPQRVVTITVTWQVPGEAKHNYRTNARIEGI